MQARYQYGTLMLRKRSKGPDVWQWRYCEGGKRRSLLVGTVDRLPTRAAAERAIEHLRVRVNSENPESQFHAVTVSALIDRYLADEAGNVREDTAKSYRVILEKWVRPKWGELPLQAVKTTALEAWLGTVPRSPGTRTHIRNMMHILFRCACRWELIERNPVDLVRQSNKRMRIPRVLTPEEFKSLLAELAEPYRTMVLVAGCLGLRISEILGLQWGDIDWDRLTLTVQRSTVAGKVYATKTEASQKPLPLDAGLADVLRSHRAASAYLSPSDFVFAGNGGRPRWQGVMLTDHIKPAAERAKLGKIGWHTFRHTFSSIVHDAGANMAVQRELLRHADIQTTMNLYTQAVSPAKRDAVQHVAAKLLLAAQVAAQVPSVVRIGTRRKCRLAATA